MIFLLDTSVLLWWLSKPARIPKATMERLELPETVILFSQISLLEIQIKVAIGKLRLDLPVAEVPGMARSSGLTPLSLSNEAIFTLAKLPALHRDPFDRLLICEAIQEGACLVTPDAAIGRYPVRTVW
jgi:PIN domain nuclease of toxin-antitoxin system